MNPRYIERENQRLAIVGVENWGKGFKQKGDLKKASSNIDSNDFKNTFEPRPIPLGISGG